MRAGRELELLAACVIAVMLAIGCGAAPVIDPPIVDTSRTGAAVTWSADAQQVVAEAHVEFALRVSGLSIQIVTDIEIDTAAGIYRVTIAIPFFDPIVVELPIEPPPPPPPPPADQA